MLSLIQQFIDHFIIFCGQSLRFNAMFAIHMRTKNVKLFPNQVDNNQTTIKTKTLIHYWKTATKSWPNPSTITKTSQAIKTTKAFRVRLWLQSNYQIINSLLNWFEKRLWFMWIFCKRKEIQKVQIHYFDAYVISSLNLIYLKPIQLNFSLSGWR
jgi:hypothetical protein